MKHQALFSSKDKSKKLNCRLLQFLFSALRVNYTLRTFPFWNLNTSSLAMYGYSPLFFCTVSIFASLDYDVYSKSFLKD